MATTYDNASLVMIPSGVKESKLYSIKPTDGSGDFTFSRGTDTATRVNASGLIEKERGNLLLQSNTFNTTWASVNSGSVTGGQSGYDGSSDAWLLTKAATNFSGIRQSVSISGVHTFSVIAKAGTLNFLWVEEYIGASIYFDLINGTTSGSGAIASSMTSLGGEWWRCELSSASAITLVTLYPQATGSPSATAGTIYIQDAQAENGLVATDYIETTTAAVYEGITDNLPRLDYSGGASCPSLLLEPSRTNLFQQSEYFGAVWTNTNSSEVSNDAISPQGVQNATKLLDAATTGDHSIQSEAVLIPYNTIRTASIYVKRGTLPAVQLRLINSGGPFSYYIVDVDLTDGSLISAIKTNVSNEDNNIVDIGDGWYRIDLRLSFNDSSCTACRLQVYTNNGTSHSYAGDGTGSIYLYGAQLEAGSYATSYIPCMGTSASRAGDNPYNTSATSVIGQTEGTLFVEFTRDELEAYTQRVITLSDGTTSNVIGFQLAQANSLTFYCVDGGVASAIITKSSATTANQKVKLAAAYANNDFVFYVDGVQVGSDSSGSVPSTSQIKFNRPTGGVPFIGDLHQVLLFKTRLTNAELAALTTI